MLKQRTRRFYIDNVRCSRALDVNALIEAFESALFPASETRILRSSMSKIAQMRDETIPDFILRIEEVGSKAYSDHVLKEEASLSALISGVSSLKIREKLLESDTSTFEEACRLATKLERIDTTLSGGKPGSSAEDLDFDVLRVDNEPVIPPPSHPPVNTVSRPPHTFGPPRDYNLSHGSAPPHNRSAPRQQIRCYGCNQLGHIRRNCPNSNRRSMPRQSSSVTCYNCNQVGHYASHCRQRRNNGNPRPLLPPAPPSTSAPHPNLPLNSNPAGRYPVHPSRM